MKQVKVNQHKEFLMQNLILDLLFLIRVQWQDHLKLKVVDQSLLKAGGSGSIEPPSLDITPLNLDAVRMPSDRTCSIRYFICLE